MNPVQIVNQVFKKKRTVSNVYDKQRKAVLFAFFVLCVLPFIFSCLVGEINRNMMVQSNTLYFPETSKFTVVFETSYGELDMNLEAALACMLPAIVPPDYEEEAIKAQAIILRTELLRLYEEQGENGTYKIYLEKTPYEKKYFTFLEQKLLYGESYSSNLAIYRHAALETAGMYMREADNADLTEAGKVAGAGWFLVSTGSTREGILCEKDYRSENYYTEKTITQREFQKELGNLYHENQAVQAEEKEQVQNKEAEEEKEVAEIHFQGAAETINFSVRFGDGTYGSLEVRQEIFCEVFGLVSPFVEEIAETNTQVTITVKGVGHGSGMSVFGANELAKEGKNYSEILNYFFTNIAIDKFE